MAFPSGASKPHDGLGSMRPDFSLDGHDWGEPEKPRRDWMKLLIVAGLGTLSWVATYVGMLELIQANMGGDLPLTHKAIIGFSVAMLMVMVVWLLDRIFSPIGALTKVIYVAGYLFLTIISVGFGFGFYWKVLESRSESSRSAESAVGQVQQSLHAASTRLEQLQATLAQLTAISTFQADVERTKGTSCPNSRPGDGPRRKLRDDDAARFGFASEFVKGRVTAVKTELGALNGDLAKIVADDKALIDAKSGTRNEFLKSLGRKLDMTVTGFNAFRTDPQLRQIRTDLAERAEKASFADGKGGSFACPDPQLSTALKGVVRAIDQLPELEKPKIAAVEGSEATIEAFRRLTATFYGLLSFKLPPSADELRDLQKKAVQSVENAGATSASRAAQNETVGLSRRDYVPLAIALFVDLCLLLVSIGRPINRLHSLVPKMRAAERGPVIQILSRFNDIHRDRQIRENFEIFRHVVFDYAGNYYVAVPLDAPPKLNPKEREDLRVEAQLLANLFASFEKDNIFKRIDNRFLAKATWSEPNAARARRRLRQQGSKFANSEAFRLYRFNDGAWSEIILGAVMGAAKRVEADQRRRTIEEGHRLPDAKPGVRPAPMPPTFPPAPARMQPPAAFPPVAPQPMRAPEMPPRPAAATAGAARPVPCAIAMPSSAARATADGDGSTANGPRRNASSRPAWSGGESGGTTEPGILPTHGPSPLGGGEDGEWLAPATDEAAIAAHAAQFGPYARHVAATASGDMAPAAQTRMPEPGPVANSSTSPSARREPAAAGASNRATAQAVALSDKVIAMPGVQVQPQGVIEPATPPPLPRAETAGVVDAASPVRSAPAQDNVTLEIKTATFTAPARDARMQAALWRAGLVGRRAEEGRSSQPALDSKETGRAPSVIEAGPHDVAGLEVDAAPEGTDDGIRIDMISRRFGPRAGE